MVLNTINEVLFKGFELFQVLMHFLSYPKIYIAAFLVFHYNFNTSFLNCLQHFTKSLALSCKFDRNIHGKRAGQIKHTSIYEKRTYLQHVTAQKWYHLCSLKPESKQGTWPLQIFRWVEVAWVAISQYLRLTSSYIPRWRLRHSACFSPFLSNCMKVVFSSGSGSCRCCYLCTSWVTECIHFLRKKILLPPWYLSPTVSEWTEKWNCKCCLCWVWQLREMWWCLTRRRIKW